MNVKTLLTCALVVGVFALGGISRADLIAGYTPGTGSQLLVANGGAGSIMLSADTAAGGGANVDDASGTASFNAVLLDGAGIWGIGDTVQISGVALALLGGTSATRTQSGTFTFEVLQGVGGSGPSGAGGLPVIGSQTAAYTSPSSAPSVAETLYANFDTPISFVVDASSTTIGIRFSSDGGHITYKSNAAAGLARYNSGNGNQPGSLQRFSVAGEVIVIPEPSTASLAVLAGVIACLRRSLRRAARA